MMHDCLQIVEILSLIFEHVYIHPKDGIKSISALAATCTRFRDPAVKILWRSLPNLLPFVRCLPSDAWEVEEFKAWHGTYGLVKLRRPLTNEDVPGRLKTYATFVKSIGNNPHHPLKHWFHSSRNTILTLPIYEALASHGILPIKNLLIYFGKNKMEFHMFPRVIGPHTTEVDFDLYPVADSITCPILTPSLTRSLPPAVSVVRFDDNYDSDEELEVKWFFDEISVLPSLEVLHISKSFLDRHELEKVLSYNKLRALEVENDAQDFLATGTLSKNSTLLLHHFRLKTTTAVEAAKVIASMNMSALQSIAVVYPEDELDGDDFPTADEVVGTLCIALETHCYGDVLTKIDIQGPALDEYIDRINGIPDGNMLLDWKPITSTILQPLYTFSKLESLTIDFAGGFGIDNASIRLFVQSWPMMEFIDLRMITFPDHPGPHPTLYAIKMMARSWPRLKHLCIPFIVNRRSIYSMDYFNIRCPTMTSFSVGNSLMLDLYQDDDKERLASFLHSVFPNLQTLENCYEHDWVPVRSKLKKLWQISRT